jgi:uncharacterized membrane protein SirB2
LTHLHITTWALAVILFFVVLGIGSNKKSGKIVHMILRLFYILVILSGVELIFRYNVFNSGQSGEYIAKIIIGIIVIALMEMILVRKGKEKPTKGLWIGFIIALILVVLLGFRLPLGF